MTTTAANSLTVDYTAARDAAAVFDLPERGGLEATGPQRQKFLQGMLTNEVERLAPGEGRPAAVLDVKGHVQALVRVLVEANAVLLETRQDRLADLQRTLEHYRVAAPVRFRVRPDALVAVLGPKADEVLAAAGADRPAAPAESHLRTTVGGRPALVARASDLPLAGFVLHVAPEAKDGVVEALRANGVASAGREILDVLRVEAVRPWLGSDVTAENLLHETGLVAECCSFSKGCYIGQEVVARLDARGGHVNKALRALKLERPAAAGAVVRAGGEDVGRVTTAAVSPRLGPIALAYVHRNHFAPGTVLAVDGAKAVVVSSFPAP
jgi:folate-binding protein YgfZ